MFSLIRPVLFSYFTSYVRDKSFDGIELMLFAFGERKNCVGHCLNSVAVVP